jgi:ribosome recycling factor
MTNSELKTRLAKTVDYFKGELSQIRTGRANPSLIEDLVVDAYDSKMTVKELGSIALLDSQTLVISVWDKSVLGNLAKAIRESNLGLNPIEDSDRIRIPVPPLTEERRKELTKIVATKAEDAKTSARSIRQEAMKDIEKDFTEKSISEDEKFSFKEDVEKIVKEAVVEIDQISETKKEELLKI